MSLGDADKKQIDGSIREIKRCLLIEDEIDRSKYVKYLRVLSKLLDQEGAPSYVAAKTDFLSLLLTGVTDAIKEQGAVLVRNLALSKDVKENKMLDWCIPLLEAMAGSEDELSKKVAKEALSKITEKPFLPTSSKKRALKGLTQSAQKRQVREPKVVGIAGFVAKLRSPDEAEIKAGLENLKTWAIDHPSEVNQFASNGVMEALLGLLNRDPASAHLLAILDRLTNACNLQPDNQATITAQAIARLTILLNDQNPDIKQYAAWALGNAAFKCEKNQALIKANPVCVDELIKNLLFPESEDVTLYAAWALAASGACEDEGYQSAIADADGIKHLRSYSAKLLEADIEDKKVMQDSINALEICRSTKRVRVESGVPVLEEPWQPLITKMQGYDQITQARVINQISAELTDWYRVTVKERAAKEKIKHHIAGIHYLLLGFALQVNASFLDRSGMQKVQDGFKNARKFLQQIGGCPAIPQSLVNLFPLLQEHVTGIECGLNLELLIQWGLIYCEKLVFSPRPLANDPSVDLAVHIVSPQVPVIAEVMVPAPLLWDDLIHLGAIKMGEVLNEMALQLKNWYAEHVGNEYLGRDRDFVELNYRLLEYAKRINPALNDSARMSAENFDAAKAPRWHQPLHDLIVEKLGLMNKRTLTFEQLLAWGSAYLASPAPVDPANLSEKEQLQLAKKQSLEEAEKQKKIGPRAILGWKLKDVEDRGNCFYEAVCAHMKLIRHPYLEAIPEGTLPRDALRLHIQGAEFKDQEWADDRIYDAFIQKFDVILAIAYTLHPETGFECRSKDRDGSINNHVDGTPLPEGKMVIRLAATGSHFLSVEQHPELISGALSEAFSPSEVEDGEIIEEVVLPVKGGDDIAGAWNHFFQKDSKELLSILSKIRAEIVSWNKSDLSSEEKYKYALELMSELSRYQKRSPNYAEIFSNIKEILLRINDPLFTLEKLLEWGQRPSPPPAIMEVRSPVVVEQPVTPRGEASPIVNPVAAVEDMVVEVVEAGDVPKAPLHIDVELLDRAPSVPSLFSPGVTDKISMGRSSFTSRSDELNRLQSQLKATEGLADLEKDPEKRKILLEKILALNKKIKTVQRQIASSEGGNDSRGKLPVSTTPFAIRLEERPLLENKKPKSGCSSYSSVAASPVADAEASQQDDCVGVLVPRWLDSAAIAEDAVAAVAEFGKIGIEGDLDKIYESIKRDFDKVEQFFAVVATRMTQIGDLLDKIPRDASNKNKFASTGSGFAERSGKYGLLLFRYATVLAKLCELYQMAINDFSAEKPEEVFAFQTFRQENAQKTVSTCSIYNANGYQVASQKIKIGKIEQQAKAILPPKFVLPISAMLGSVGGGSERTRRASVINSFSGIAE